MWAGTRDTRISKCTSRFMRSFALTAAAFLARVIIRTASSAQAIDRPCHASRALPRKYPAAFGRVSNSPPLLPSVATGPPPSRCRYDPQYGPDRSAHAVGRTRKLLIGGNPVARGIPSQVGLYTYYSPVVSQERCGARDWTVHLLGSLPGITQ